MPAVVNLTHYLESVKEHLSGLSSQGFLNVELSCKKQLCGAGEHIDWACGFGKGGFSASIRSAETQNGLQWLENKPWLSSY